MATYFDGLGAWEALRPSEWAAKPAADVDFVCECFCSGSQRPVRDVLDVGCGDGAMLVPLAERGYVMTGIDECDSRLERCRKAIEKRGFSASVRHSDMQSLVESESFDAILAMDSVPNYLLEDDAILDLLRRLHGALRPGGLLLLDIWNMLAQGEILDRPIVICEARLGSELTFEEVHHLDSLRGRMHIQLHATVSGSDGLQRRSTTRKCCE